MYYNHEQQPTNCVFIYSVQPYIVNNMLETNIFDVINIITKSVVHTFVSAT